MTSTITGCLVIPIRNHNKKKYYPLPALTLSKDKCDELIKMIKDAGLPHYSIFRKFPLSLVHVTINYLGLDIGNLYIMQGSHQIEIVHGFLSSSEMTGYLIWLEI